MLLKISFIFSMTVQWFPLLSPSPLTPGLSSAKSWTFFFEFEIETRDMPRRRGQQTLCARPTLQKLTPGCMFSSVSLHRKEKLDAFPTWHSPLNTKISLKSNVIYWTNPMSAKKLLKVVKLFDRNFTRQQNSLQQYDKNVRLSLRKGDIMVTEILSKEKGLI